MSEEQLGFTDLFASVDHSKPMKFERVEYTVEDAIADTALGKESVELAVVNMALADVIASDETGILRWLFNYFSTEEKPLTPVEWWEFFETLDHEEINVYANFALDSIYPGTSEKAIYPPPPLSQGNPDLIGREY